MLLTPFLFMFYGRLFLQLESLANFHQGRVQRFGDETKQALRSTKKTPLEAKSNSTTFEEAGQSR